jgi:hypothetical protein
MCDDEAKKQFRFTIPQLLQLITVFQLQQTKTKHGVVVEPLEGLCIVLRRLVFPARWIDMAAMFCRAPSTLHAIFYHVAEFLLAKYQNILFFDEDRISQNVDHFSSAILRKEPKAPAKVWGFIDGTLRPTCRPKHGQQALYNGHKRRHGFKFQTIVTPDGIIAHFFGPVDGRRHDIYMLRLSGIEEVLEKNSAFHGKVVYGDPAYGCSNVFCCPHKGCQLNIHQRKFNRAMSGVRVSVEWTYGQIVNYFSYLDYHRQLKVFKSPVAELYKLGVLFVNCVTIMQRTNTNASYFECEPPTLEEYFHVNKW